MASITDVKYKEPYAEHLTLKLTRADAIQILDAYEQAWKRSNFAFRFDGKLPAIYNDLYKVVFNSPSKFGQKVSEPKTFTDLVNQMTAKSEPFGVF